MTYAKLNGGTLEYLPKILTTQHGQVINPTEEEIKGAGYKPVVDEIPKTAPSEIATRTGWIETDREIRGRYEIHDRPPEVHVYDSRKLIRALKKEKCWDRVWAFIQRHGLEAEWNACTSFRDDDPEFGQFFPEIQKELNLPPDKVSDIMDASKAD